MMFQYVSFTCGRPAPAHHHQNRWASSPFGIPWDGCCVPSEAKCSWWLFGSGILRSMPSVKHFASSYFMILYKAQLIWHCTKLQSFSSEEALLAMPYEFMQPLLNSCPGGPRPLRPLNTSKRTKCLEVARVLLRRFPSSTTGRAVDFLVDLVQNLNPGPAPELIWYSTPGSMDDIRIGLPPVAQRVLPAMVFEARFGR